MYTLLPMMTKKMPRFDLRAKFSRESPVFFQPSKLPRINEEITFGWKKILMLQKPEYNAWCLWGFATSKVQWNTRTSWEIVPRGPRNEHHHIYSYVYLNHFLYSWTIFFLLLIFFPVSGQYIELPSTKCFAWYSHGLLCINRSVIISSKRQERNPVEDSLDVPHTYTGVQYEVNGSGRPSYCHTLFRYDREAFTFQKCSIYRRREEEKGAWERERESRTWL